MLSCMGISGNWRTVVRNLAIGMSPRKLRGGMPTSADRLKKGLVRKALKPYGRVLDGVEDCELGIEGLGLSLIHISEPTRPY